MFRKTAFIGCASLIAAVSSGTALAENRMDAYAGIHYSYLDAEVDFGAAGTLNTNPQAAYVTLGKKLNANFAAEIRAGTGTFDDDGNVAGVNIDTEVDYIYGVYFKAGSDISHQLHPYLVLGWSWVKATAEAGGLRGSEDDDDISYGIGVSWAASPDLSLNLEYMGWYDEESIEVAGFSLGVAFNF